MNAATTEPARKVGQYPAKCLKCRKPSRPGSNFCSAKCKTAWQSNMSAWHRRLPKCEDQDAPTLF
jgi:Zn-dependent alcohol dehydrogenase